MRGRPAGRRVLGLASMVGLGALFVTWPGAHRAAALGVALVVAVIVFFLLNRRRWAMASLGVLAVASMFVEGSLSTWQAWMAPFLFAASLHAVLSVSRDPALAWVKTGAVTGGLIATGALAWMWRPTRSALVGEEDVVVVVGLMGAVAIGLVLWSTAESDEALVGEA